MEVLWTDDFVAFGSRHHVFNEIMETLRDESITIIGICGMGGIGKTKLAMEIGKKSKNEGGFDNVVMTMASQDPDIRRMQGILADMLHLKLKGTSEADRAAELSESLKKERRVLIILDDVWEKLNLADIGMPSTLDHKCCKLVLTTRLAQVCNHMCCQRMFYLNVLDDSEALDLFSKHARITPYENPQHHSKAKKVVKECGGLPLAIETVGSALRKKSLLDYDDAIRKLSHSAYADIESVDREIYPAIKLSVDYLNCKETVGCLTLFSLHPEDSEIQLEEFTRIAFGIGLFENVNSIEEARHNTLRCVTRLLDACLLLPSQGTLESWKSFQQIYETWNKALVHSHRFIPSVKVHDIVRDVALWLSRKDKFFYMQKSPSKKQSKEYEDAIAISMKDCGLDCRLKCPKLKLLLVETGISGLQDGCFEMMSALQVLKVNVVRSSNTDIFAENTFPASIQHLHDLRTFLFDGFYGRWCTGNLSVIGMLKNLQILRLDSWHIEELPQEIGELSSLKLLDLSGCRRLEKIPRNVLSSLTALEELYFGDKLEVEKDVFLEITSLPHLTALTARVNFARSLPTVSFRKPLRRYAILDVEPEWSRSGVPDVVPERSRNVVLYIVDCSQMASLRQLFPQVEFLYIKILQGTWENLFSGCSEDPLLKIDARYLYRLLVTTRTCPVRPALLSSNLQLVLADMSEMTRLCNSPSPPGWPPNISEAYITRFHGSQNIVPHIIPIGSKLQDLQVTECVGLKHIFEFDPQHLPHITNEMSLLPSPTDLILRDLHELTAIWKWPHQTEILDLTKNDSHDNFCNLIPEAMFRSWSSLATLEILWCEKVDEVFQLIYYSDQKYKEQLSNLTTVRLLDLRQLRYIWKGPQQNLHLRKLEYIELSGCSKLTSIFTPASATSLRKLRSIRISWCEALESIISPEEDELSTSAASSLMVVSTPELEEIRISSCHELKSILPVSILAQGLPQLRDISITDCAKLEQVFKDREGTLMSRDEIALNSLKKLELENLPSLVDFSTAKGHLICPSLKVLTVKCCPLLGKSFRIGQALDGYVHRKEQVQRQNLNNEAVEGQLIEYCQDIVRTSPLHNLVSLHYVKLTDFHEAKELFDFSGMIIDQNLCSCLESLHLRSLKALNQLWRGPIHSVQLLYLRWLRIRECPNLRTLFTSTIIAGSLKKLEVIEIKNCINLENILVMGELDFSKVPFFPALSKIEIKGCNKLKSVLPLSVAQELPQLQSLEIENCRVLQHVFSADEGEHTDYGNLHDIKLPNLRSLKLAQLPSSMLFTSANLLVSCPNLQDFFFEDIEESEPTHLTLRFLDTKVAEPSTPEGMDGSDINDVCQRLADIRLIKPRVVLNEFPVLKCLWKGPTNFVRMTCLSHIEVGNCVGLKTLFTQSIAQTLCFLETIAIYNCKELEYIIEPSDHHVEGEEESFSTVTYLERLRKISIERCERLKFILPLSVAQRLPSLTEISVKGARQLEQLFSDDERIGCAEDKDKDIELPKLIERVSISTCLPKLRVIEVQECERLTSIFPLSVARQLPSLKKMSVKRAHHLEQLFSDNEREGCAEGKEIEVPELRTLELEDLPCLSHILPAGYVISGLSFSKLRAVFIRNCGIEDVFDCTLECGGLYQGPVFANLTVLYLCCLPNLISIWKATYPCSFMGFNRLKFLHVEGCERITTIFPRDQYFPALETVHVEGAVNLQTVFDSPFPQWTIWLRAPQLKTARRSHLPYGVLSNPQSAHVSDACASYIKIAAYNNLFDLDGQVDVDVHAALEAYHQVKRRESDDLHHRQHLQLAEHKAQ